MSFSPRTRLMALFINNLPQLGQLSSVLWLKHRLTVSDLLLRGRKFQREGVTGRLTALFAIGLREEFVDCHWRRALVGFCVGRDLVPPFPGAVIHVDQAVELHLGCSAI